MMRTKCVRNISTTLLKSELKDRNKQFLDVQTPGKFKGYHIKELTNIPLHQLAKKVGFTKVTNVKGGMSAWS